MGIDKRKYQRVPLMTEVQSSKSGAPLVLPMRDISIGGLFVQTKHNLPHGTVLQMRFYLDGKVLIEAEGKVVYTAPGLGLGIEFTELPPNQREAIEGFINAQPETPPESASETPSESEEAGTPHEAEE